MPPTDATFSLNLLGTSDDSRFYGDLPRGVQNAVDEIARAVLDPDCGQALVIGYQSSGKSFLIEQFAGNVEHYLQKTTLEQLHVLEVSRADSFEFSSKTGSLDQYLGAVCSALDCGLENLCFVTEAPEFAALLFAHSPKTKVLLELNSATYSQLNHNEHQGVSKIWSSWGRVSANEVFLTQAETVATLESVMVPKLSASGLASLDEGEVPHLVEHFLAHMPELLDPTDVYGVPHPDGESYMTVAPGLWGLSVRRLASALAFSSAARHRDDEGNLDVCAVIDSVFEELAEDFVDFMTAMEEGDEDDDLFPMLLSGISDGARLRILELGHNADEEGESPEAQDSTPLEFSDITTLSSRLKKTVLGQDEAVESVASGMIVPAAGIHDSTKPLRTFLFLGPTGVGKTQLAQSLAQEVASEPLNLIRLDMSEYSQSHEASKLLGAPSGYVGYEEGGVLTNAVLAHPRSLILLDEVEKAHPKIWDSFLQIFDAGRMTDNKGREVDFTKTIIVMTSNLGSREASGAAPTGFGSLQATAAVTQARSTRQVEEFFKPEFINRIDEVIFFKQLSMDTAREIVRREITLVAARMGPKGFKLKNYEDAIVDEIIKLSSFSKYGARDIQRAVFKNVSQPLAMRMLAKGKRGKTIALNISSDNKIQVK